MKNKLIVVLIISSIMFSFANPGYQAKAADNSLSEIINKDSSYANYNVETKSDDYNKDGSKETFYIFTKKGTKKNDNLNYCADIWFADGSKISRIVKWQYILPDTYGTLKLAGRKYFRYDLSYATDSQTILLGVNNHKCVECFAGKGGARFSKNKNDFTVLCSAYDMVYSKEDGICTGHTWKDYYFYIDSKGFHEYGAKKISKSVFLKYSNASAILKRISEKYGKKGTRVTCTYLKRCNGLVHVNIQCRRKNEITYYYNTYRIYGKNGLKIIESGDGKYLTASNKKLAVYFINN